MLEEALLEPEKLNRSALEFVFDNDARGPRSVARDNLRAWRGRPNLNIMLGLGGD